jgi:hypothetical protein
MSYNTNNKRQMTDTPSQTTTTTTQSRDLAQPESSVKTKRQTRASKVAKLAVNQPTTFKGLCGGVWQKILVELDDIREVRLVCSFLNRQASLMQTRIANKKVPLSPRILEGLKNVTEVIQQRPFPIADLREYSKSVATLAQFARIKRLTVRGHSQAYYSVPYLQLLCGSFPNLEWLEVRSGAAYQFADVKDVIFGLKFLKGIKMDISVTKEELSTLVQGVNTLESISLSLEFQTLSTAEAVELLQARPGLRYIRDLSGRSAFDWYWDDESLQACAPLHPMLEEVSLSQPITDEVLDALCEFKGLRSLKSTDAVDVSCDIAKFKNLAPCLTELSLLNCEPSQLVAISSGRAIKSISLYVDALSEEMCRLWSSVEKLDLRGMRLTDSDRDLLRRYCPRLQSLRYAISSQPQTTLILGNRVHIGERNGWFEVGVRYSDVVFAHYDKAIVGAEAAMLYNGASSIVGGVINSPHGKPLWGGSGVEVLSLTERFMESAHYQEDGERCKSIPQYALNARTADIEGVLVTWFPNLTLNGCSRSGAFVFAINGRLGWRVASLDDAVKWLVLVLSGKKPRIRVFFPFAEIAWRYDGSGFLEIGTLENYCAMTLRSLQCGSDFGGIAWTRLDQHALAKIQNAIGAPDERGTTKQRLRNAIRCAFLNIKNPTQKMEFRCDGSPFKITVCSPRVGCFSAKIWEHYEHIPIATIDRVVVNKVGDWILSKTDDAWSNLSSRMCVNQQL